MLRIAIIVDKLKLPIFDKYLKESDFKYEQQPGIIENTLLLSVELNVSDINKMKDIIDKANSEARRSKMQ